MQHHQSSPCPRPDNEHLRTVSEHPPRPDLSSPEASGMVIDLLDPALDEDDAPGFVW